MTEGRKVTAIAQWNWNRGQLMALGKTLGRLKNCGALNSVVADQMLRNCTRALELHEKQKPQIKPKSDK